MRLGMVSWTHDCVFIIQHACGKGSLYILNSVPGKTCSIAGIKVYMYVDTTLI